MRAIRRVASSLPELFGFAVLALVLSTADCRVNRLKAQEEDIVIPNPCSEERLRALYGDDWHIYYALLGCWIMESTQPYPSQPIRTDRHPLMSRVRFR